MDALLFHPKVVHIPRRSGLLMRVVAGQVNAEHEEPAEGPRH